MTTNLDVDLRELFVMPRVFVRSSSKENQDAKSPNETVLMDLAAARAFFGEQEDQGNPVNQEKEENDLSVLDQVKRYPRNVIIGVPGSGKSTFLEWLQVKLAAVEEELVMAGNQAIPLLLRIRQLDPYNLPHGAALIEKATASKDRATLMPFGWIDRQMQAGRVLFMLDGLDEVEPALRDQYVLPWLRGICQQYPYCRYLVSSRPVGYPDRTLRQLEFAECDLLDFTEPQISEYTRHWCTAVRLARNEPEEEARQEGEVDGARIVEGFKGHPYIPNLARNPLMLSAICLVNYFEGGHLPKDRAVLYRLCVEGLLHHWDQRRGIHSEFALEEKLRVCREVALCMQTDDRAEYEAEKIQQVFFTVLGDKVRAKQLLKHIRYRTGLLLERRPNIFAFAHLTFQEYLAARAIYEGNRRNITADQMIREHNDGRWNEVIALYCGLAPTSAAKEVIERLIAQPDSFSLSSVLSEAYLSTGSELAQDLALRKNVLQRIARAPLGGMPGPSLDRFPAQEVAPVANLVVGQLESDFRTSESHVWLRDHSVYIDWEQLAARLSEWQKLNPVQIGELIHLFHAHGSDTLLATLAADSRIYALPGPKFSLAQPYYFQAEVAFFGLSFRASKLRKKSQELLASPGIDAAFLQILRILSNPNNIPDIKASLSRNLDFLEKRCQVSLPQDATTWPEFATLTRRLTEHLSKTNPEGKKPATHWTKEGQDKIMNHLNTWADALERAIAAGEQQRTKKKSPPVVKIRKRKTVFQRARHES